MKKVAIVTGSARGIGKKTALIFSENGYDVIFSDVVEKADFELPKGCAYHKCDISSEADRKAIFKFAEEKYGRLDVLVNNAGVAPKVRRDLLEMTEESLRFVLDINLVGTTFMCQEGSRLLTETAKKYGEATYIVNTSSISAYTSSTSRGEYCISKAGVEMITSLFADRLAESNVKVFAVRPGIIMTDMTAVVKDKYEKLIAEGITPIKRFGQPEDVGKAVLGLCSGAFDFCTGTAVNADGGFHIRRL